MPPNRENARDGEDHASVLGISKGRSTLTQLSELVNNAPETALAHALRVALARGAVPT